MEDSILYVIVNEEAILEFDRSKPVPGHQRQYLDNMDSQMDQGIQLGKDFIQQPNALQRSQFVANSLINHLFKDEYSVAIAMCTYLGKRMPDLKQVKCKGEEDKELSIELVFDRSYEQSQQEQKIQFYKPDKMH
ncbi:MAG TPA: hypothetical protein EYH38_10780 [Leucothrix sp.]|nr:hypothetical protein [Leucothrix sp.]HIQ16029.1 hypothetical protein [Leucothrix sp.]